VVVLLDAIVLLSVGYCVAVAPRSGKRPSELSNEDLAAVLDVVVTNRELFLREYRAILRKKHKLCISNAALCRAFHVSPGFVRCLCMLRSVSE
jgi:hypothetical protein